jgi:uncharacterized protein (DUF3820 family)
LAERQDCLSGTNTHDVILTFGKHKGERLTKVPRSYLTWLLYETGMALKTIMGS